MLFILASEFGRFVTMNRLLLVLVSVAGVSLGSGFPGLGSEDQVVHVPFDFTHRVILVQTRIGGKGPFTMLLDTDTDPSTIDLSFAKSNGLRLRKIAGDVTGGGSEHPQVFLTKLARVELGTLPARDLQAVAIDLTKIRDRLGKDIQGVLGKNFLSRRIIQIDFPKGVLRFYQSSFLSDNAKNGRVILPFTFDEDDGCIVIQGVVVNGKRITATIDTGSDGTFKLAPAAVDYLGLAEASSKGKSESSVGYKGTAQNTTGKLDEISIGSIGVNAPEVVFLGKGTGRDHKPWGLSIGNAFLKDYIVTIDYQEKLIALEKP
jgi:aspartyl protease